MSGSIPSWISEMTEDSKDELIKKHRFLIRRLSIGKWELECTDEKINRGSKVVKEIQKSIDEYLDKYVIDDGTLREMNRDELMDLVKKDLEFFESVFKDPTTGG